MLLIYLYIKNNGYIKQPLIKQRREGFKWAPLDFLKEFEDRAIDAASYKLLQRNFEIQEQNNRLLQDKVSLLEDKITDLQTHIEKLEQENSDLRKMVRQQAEQEDFCVFQGIAFKRDKNGNFEGIPYCPNCKIIMSDISGIYDCPSCKYVKELGKRPDVLARELNDIPK